jgi:hypothetical protein
MEKKEIINHLNNLLKSNLWASTQLIFEKAYRNRIIGFRSELDFFSDFSDRELFEGGYILPTKKGSETLDKPIYFTTSSRNESEFLEIYNVLSKSIFSKLFYIKFLDYDFKNWEKESLKGVEYPIPKFNVYEFVDSKFNLVSNSVLTLSNHYEDKVSTSVNYKISQDVENECFLMMEKYSLENLINIYVDRLVFDGFIGFTKVRGIASDIDAIVKNNNIYIFCEIKEKDLSKKYPIGFGMDTRRVNNIVDIKKTYNCDYFYIVKQVDNQEERKFLKWHYIEINNFVKETQNNEEIEGGAGMSNIGKNLTLVCELKHFSNF